MLPRKRQRPNTTTAVSREMATSRTPATSTAAAASAEARPSMSTPTLPFNEPPSSTASTSAPPPIPPIPPIPMTGPDPVNQKQVRKAKSWYGQWPKTPKKASASTSVARENILGGTIRSAAAPNLGRFESAKANNAGTTRARSISQLLPPSKAPDHGGMSARARPTPTAATTGTNTVDGEDKENQKPVQKLPVIVKGAAKEPSTSTAPARQQEDEAHSARWLSWWAKTPPSTEQQTVSANRPDDDEAKLIPVARPVTPPQPQAAPSDPLPKKPPQRGPVPAPSSPWFGLWSSAHNDKMKKSETDEDAKSGAAKPKAQGDVIMQDAPPPPAALAAPPHPPAAATPTAPDQAPKAGSTWAFWSKASPGKAGNKGSAPGSGEIAVMGEGSEAQPTHMAEDDVSGPQGKKDVKAEAPSKDAPPATRSTWRKKKRVRPPSLEAASDAESSTSAVAPTTQEPHPSQGLQPPRQRETRAQTPAPIPLPALKVENPSSSSASVAESETASKQPPNLLLPSFSSTYRMKDNPSILQQITKLLLRTSQPPANHVFRARDPPKIRTAMAIGVHGFFPATYLRPMIGQPTGTSLRFANLCAEAIRRWTDAHGSPDCEIEKVALEGEGRIGDRVDNLWKLMLNWIEHIRKADFIIIACHSQGVPVSIILLEKLIDLGIITNAKIGVCAMAGVALGPFPDYKSSILMGSAAELWDFGNPQSTNSQRFQASLKRVLDYGARVTFIGSIDDQLVPMESAVYSPATHPYIYRAVFIDGRIHAPDFIAHLVGFALKLRNLGITDHGLIRELSIALAGSLYSGEGHSRIYYDPAVYDLAVSHALETTPTPTRVPCEVGPREGLASTNPYVLPWIMRGMLEEDFVKTELSSETEELLRQFDDWKPSNKALKDVKYRLEAVRSKL